jgi:hypothetical protein
VIVFFFFSSLNFLHSFDHVYLHPTTNRDPCSSCYDLHSLSNTFVGYLHQFQPYQTYHPVPLVMISTHYQTPSLVTFTNFNPTKLTSTNYPVWLPQIVSHLKGGNIYGYVDGSTPCPSPTVTSTKDGVSTTSPNPAFLHWSMQDQLLLGAINSVLSEKMLTHVTRCATSHDAWTTLETLFTSQTKARTMQVHYQLATLKKGSSSIADYYHTFQTLCDALAVVG